MKKIKLDNIYQGNAIEVLKTLPDESIDMVMTSPPYWALRDYGVENQLGLEPTFNEFIDKLCNIFDEIKRVLKKEGSCWVNLGDTYMGNSSYSEKGRQGFEQKDGTRKKYSCNIKDKCLCMIPERFAIEMVNRGWILRNQIIWQKPNCMPSSAHDRFTVDFEKIFLFVKSKKYYFQQQKENSKWAFKDSRFVKGPSVGGKAMEGKYQINCGGAFSSDGMRNKRTTWTIETKGYSEAHFAVYPEKLCETPIKAGCPEKGIVLDPFFGAGTTGLVAKKLNRNFVGIELNSEYIELAKKRLQPFMNKNLDDFN